MISFKQITFIILFTWFFGILGGCALSSRVPEPVQEHVEYADSHWPGTTLDSLKQYRRLYIMHCSSCHFLVSVKKFPSDEWPHWVEKMSNRAHLTSSESEKILRYLITADNVKIIPKP